MRIVISVLGVIAAAVVMLMICFSPDAKENFKEDHYKSLILAIVPMIVLLVLAYYVLSHVGL